MGTYEEIMNLLENGKLIGTKKNPEFDLMEVHYLNKKFSEWCNCFCLDKNGLIEAILESKKATEVMTNIAMAWLLALKFQFSEILTPNEKKAVILKYGFDQGTLEKGVLSLREISSKMGYSPESVRKFLNNALKKLRLPQYGRCLMPNYDYYISSISNIAS